MSGGVRGRKSAKLGEPTDRISPYSICRYYAGLLRRYAPRNDEGDCFAVLAVTGYDPTCDRQAYMAQAKDERDTTGGLNTRGIFSRENGTKCTLCTIFDTQKTKTERYSPTLV